MRLVEVGRKLIRFLPWSSEKHASFGKIDGKLTRFMPGSTSEYVENRPRLTRLVTRKPLLPNRLTLGEGFDKSTTEYLAEIRQKFVLNRPRGD